MNSDIRLSVDFFDHPKTLKLERRLGASAVHALVRLWCFAAKNRSDGCLTNMDSEDIELAARFNSSLTVVERSLTVVNGVATNNGFVDTLLELRWLDLSNDGKTYLIHDWKTHNSYASEAEDRSDSSRLSRLSSVNRAAYESLVASGRTGITREEWDIYKRKTASVHNENEPFVNDSLTVVDASLSPAPAPAPIPKHKKEDIPELMSGLHPLAVLWNEIVGDPRVTSCSKSRLSKAKVRLKELSIEDWRSVMEAISNTPFLRGDNDRGWRADFDWLITNDTNYVKVMEGKYSRSGSAPKSREQHKQENNLDAIQKFLGGNGDDSSGQSGIFAVNG